MTKWIKSFIAIFIIAISVGALSACSSSKVASPDQQIEKKNYNEKTPFVEDNAHVLSEDTYDYIKNLNDELQSTKLKSQILVVTISDLDGNSIADVAAKKGEQYGIGNSKTDSGLVYVLAVNDHKDFLATGYGMESVITDSMATDILENTKSHDAYKDNNYDKGLMNNLKQIKPYLIGEKTKTDYKKEKEKDNKITMWIIIILIIIGCPTIIALAILFNDDDSSSGSSGGWSSGSSDGWSGGGGDFGGGGGGSSW